MARYLVDENLTWRLAQALTAEGHEASDAFSVGLGSRPDEEVFAYAREHGLTLITRDQGFGNPVRYPPGAEHAGIIVARFPKEWTNVALIPHIAAAVRQLQQEQLGGAVVVIEPARIRVRKAAKQ